MDHEIRLDKQILNHALGKRIDEAFELARSGDVECASRDLVRAVEGVGLNETMVEDIEKCFRLAFGDYQVALLSLTPV